MKTTFNIPSPEADMPDTPAPTAAVEVMARSIGGASYGKEHLWDANAALRALASADEPTRLAAATWLLPPGWRLAHDGLTRIVST